MKFCKLTRKTHPRIQMLLFEFLYRLVLIFRDISNFIHFGSIVSAQTFKILKKIIESTFRFF